MNARYLTFGLVLAAAAGWLLATIWPDVPALATGMQLAKQLFLGALKLIIGPLIFFSIFTGIVTLRDTRGGVRKLGSVTLLYYLLTTAIAIALGLGVVAFVHPWTSGPVLEGFTAAQDIRYIDVGEDTTSALLLSILDRLLMNPVSAFMSLNILGIVTNAVLFALAALLTLPADARLFRVTDDLTAIAYRIAGWAVALVPVGVLGIIFELTRSTGLAVVGQLVEFSLVVLAATAVHGLIVLPLIAWLLAGRTPGWLLPRLSRPAMVALTTSSSTATLPVSLQTAETELGVSRTTASFVLPLGATINMDGTALFEGIAAVFLAYLFQVDLGTVGIFSVFFIAMLASIGAPGIPSGSMAGMQMVLLAVGIPLEAIGLLLLVERPLDTFRTSVNVMGDLVGTLVVERFAGLNQTHG